MNLALSLSEWLNVFPDMGGSHCPLEARWSIMIIVNVILVSQTFYLLCLESGAWELRGAGVELWAKRLKCRHPNQPPFKCFLAWGCRC